jgi:hypothetical protein
LLACIALAAVASAVFGSAVPPAAADSPATAVLDWNKHAFDALNNAPTNPTTPGAGMATPPQAVHMAMVQGAVYDAVNSIAGGYEPYLDVPAAPSSASQAAAVATAAHDVLVAVLNQTPLTAAFTGAVRQSIIDRLGLREGRVDRRGDGCRRCSGCGRRDRRRRGRSRGDDRRTLSRRGSDRRPLGPVPLHVRRGAGSVATGHVDRVHDAFRPE